VALVRRLQNGCIARPASSCSCRECKDYPSTNPLWQDHSIGSPTQAAPAQFGRELCSVLFGNAGLKGIGDLAAGVINEDARSSGLDARDVPVCSTEIAELAETDAVNFAGASPSAVIESSVRIFRRRVQEENTLPPVTRS
jgi:hypothetical protein